MAYRRYVASFPISTQPEAGGKSIEDPAQLGVFQDDYNK